MRDFKKYNVWQASHLLTLKIFKVTHDFPTNESYKIVSQMQRAAYSIPSNFAEGCGRHSDKEFDRFIQISLGSAHELEYFIILSKDLGYITGQQANEIDVQINDIKKQLFALSRKLKGL